MCCFGVYFVKKWATLTIGIREFPPMIKYGKVQRCKSENNVATVAVSEEPRVPDDPRQENQAVHRVTDCFPQVSRHRETDLEWDQTQASQLAGTTLSHIFLQDPDCEVCELTETSRAPCSNRLEARGDRAHHPPKFGDAITPDHKVLNEENESR